jgi:hypothetical protein
MPSYRRGPRSTVMKHQHVVSVDSAPAAKLDAFQLRFLPTFIGPFQNSTSLSLSDSGQNSDHHFAHISIVPLSVRQLKEPTSFRWLF